MLILVGVLLVVSLVIGIIHQLAGQRVQITETWRVAREPQPHTVYASASQEALSALLSQCSSEWVVYQGSTPATSFLIRGQTQHAYRTLAVTRCGEAGYPDPASMPPQLQPLAVINLIAEAYILDWRGPTYTNGVAMPFSPLAAVGLMNRDEHLQGFILTHAHRLGPPWPAD